MMGEFDDNIPARDFDNFQFVNFTEIMSKNRQQFRKETEFALAALMEIPSQYKATMELDLLGEVNGISPERFAIPPPVYSEASSSSSEPLYPSLQHSTSSHYESNISGDKFLTITLQNILDTEDSVMISLQNMVSSASIHQEPNVSAHAVPTAQTSTYEPRTCPICLENPKDC